MNEWYHGTVSKVKSNTRLISLTFIGNSEHLECSCRTDLSYLHSCVSFESWLEDRVCQCIQYMSKPYIRFDFTSMSSGPCSLLRFWLGRNGRLRLGYRFSWVIGKRLLNRSHSCFLEAKRLNPLSVLHLSCDL